MDLERVFDENRVQEISVEDMINQILSQSRLEPVSREPIVQVIIPGSPKWAGAILKTVYISSVEVSIEGFKALTAVLYEVRKRNFYAKKVLPSRKLIYTSMPYGTLFVLKFDQSGMPSHYVPVDNNGKPIRIEDEEYLQSMFDIFKEKLIAMWGEVSIAGGENLYTPIVEALGLMEKAKAYREVLKNLQDKF